MIKIHAISWLNSQVIMKLHKTYIPLLFIFLFLFPEVQKMWIITDFEINREYIARVLCINRDKPEMGCNGKCHLKEQLQKTENPREEKSPTAVNDNRDQIYYPSFVSILKEPNHQNKTAIPGYISNLNPSIFIYSIFRPPKTIS